MKTVMRIWILLLLLLSLSFGHDSKPAYLQIKALDTHHYDVLWKVPMQSSKKKYMLNVKFDESIKNSHEPAEVEVAGWKIMRWRISTDSSLLGKKIKIEGLSSTAKEVLLRYIDIDGNKISSLISPNKPVYTFTQESKGDGVVLAYTKMGIEHILEGTDHLLFVACLVMIANTFGKLLWTITGFTLAHSVTLFLSALGIVHMPIPPIEASIALSIVFLAIEIAKNNKNSLTYRYPVIVSSSFGLLHGFGFASALMEIGLPQNERVKALLFFNVGVELGQLAFVMVLLVFSTLLFKIWKSARNIEWNKIVSYAIGSIAMMWLLQRLLLF